jgi:hypothetical protein
MRKNDLAVTLFYAAVALIWVYGALNWSEGLNQHGYNDQMIAVSIAFLGLVHVAVGYYGRSIWLLALPAFLVAVAVPAGDFPTTRPEFPIWFGLLLLSPLLLVLTGLGMAARRFGRGRFGTARVPTS